MKIKRPWYSDFGAIWVLWVLVLIADFAVILLHQSIFAVGMTLFSLTISLDHALWNISDKEEKWLDTGFGCGFRIWLK